MHTYRKHDNEWQVGYYRSDDIAFEPRGPLFATECEAAAYACFLNGGRFNPYEIEALFRIEPVLVEDDDVTYPRPEGMDYEPEPKRARK